MGITSLNDGIMHNLHFCLNTSLYFPNFSTVTVECLYNIIVKGQTPGCLGYLKNHSPVYLHEITKPLPCYWDPKLDPEMCAHLGAYFVNNCRIQMELPLQVLEAFSNKVLSSQKPFYTLRILSVIFCEACKKF